MSFDVLMLTSAASRGRTRSMEKQTVARSALSHLVAYRPAWRNRVKFWLCGKKAIFSCPVNLEFISILFCFLVQQRSGYNSLLLLLKLM